MAQFNSANGSLQGHNKTLFEVNQLATTNGLLVSEYNPYPVQLGAAQSDSFGRLRTSQPFTLGDYKHIYGIDPNFVNKLTGSGAITYYNSQACARLSTTSNSIDSVVHQTKFYHHYMPGKSQLIKSTFNFYAAVANVTKRTGYFDNNNGIFFEQAGDGTLSFCIRSSVSGSPSDSRKVSSANWNIDKCDGTGASKFNLDITKTQIFFIDFQWLGVGRVRCGFVHDGDTIIAHEFYTSNLFPTVYMSNPNLPVRCEIRNTGVTTGSYMDQICSTVISEGGYVESGQDWSVTSPSLRTLTTGSSLPILAIRLKNAFNTYANRMTVRAGNLNVLSTGENIKYRLIKLPNDAALTGGSWADVSTGSSGVEYNATATAWTGGDEIDNGFVTAATQGGRHTGGAPASHQPSSAKKNYIVQNFDSSDSEIYIVAATNIGTASTNIGVGFQWREIY